MIVLRSLYLAACLALLLPVLSCHGFVEDASCQIGDSRPDDECLGNTCKCIDTPDARGWACTKRPCADACEHNGDLYEIGDSRPDDECLGNTCECWDMPGGPGWACTEMACMPIAGTASIDVVIDLPEIEGIYPPGATRHFVEWDTGTAFFEVRSIVLELHTEGTSEGLCTNAYPGVCTPSSFAHAWLYTDESNRPSYTISIGHFGPTGHVGSKLYSGPKCLSFSLDSTGGLDLGECVSWHDIEFRAGRGVLEFGFALDEARSPGSILEAKLVVTGIPLP